MDLRSNFHLSVAGQLRIIQLQPPEQPFFGMEQLSQSEDLHLELVRQSHLLQQGLATQLLAQLLQVLRFWLEQHQL
jgi:hypothetical protein